MAVMQIAPEIKAKGVSVYLYHPGVVETDMAKICLPGVQAGDVTFFGSKMLSAQELAASLVQLMLNASLEKSPCFLDWKGETLPF